MTHKSKSQKPRRGRTGRSNPNAAPTKLDVILHLVKRADGASLDELCRATGWQAHSVRGALAGALKRKGYSVASERTEAGRVYRMAGPS